jgi:glycosyltransferase involved in cell wall biosynthesis
LVSEFGCVVEQDAGDWCDAIYLVLNNDKTGKDLGRKGRQFVARELSWDRIVRMVEEIYRNVTARGSCPGL